MKRLIGGRGLEHGLVFRVWRPARNATPTHFGIATPEGVGQVRGSIKPIRARDPAMQRAADRVTELANDDLASGLAAAEGEATDLREMDALRRAVTQVVAEKRMKRDDLTVHGFRSTFRDWGAERTQFPRKLVEKVLAHILADATEAAHQRGDMFEKRRRMMEAWTKFCDQSGIG